MTPAETPVSDVSFVPASLPEPAPGPLRPRRAARRDWFRAGFFFAAGTIVLLVLAAALRRVGEASLEIVAPFALGMTLALLLDPLADKLERRGLTRMGAVSLVFGLFLVFVVGAAFLIVPMLVAQAGDLAQNGPQFVQGLQGTVNTFLHTHHKIGPVTLPRNVAQLSDQVSGYTANGLKTVSGHLAGYLVGSVTILINVVLTLIVAFFLLLDIDRLRARLFYLIPEKHRALMAQLGNDVGGVFSDYLRGLLIVCALYGVATIGLLYGLSLWHRPLAHYALLVGAAAGILYAVPYVGSLTTALVTFLVAFAAGTTAHHSGLGFAGIAVGLTLAVNQIFDNIVTPRVVGGGVGLHPVASIFALTLGAALFGVTGMLLSVPVAASVQVVCFRLFPRLASPTPAPFLRAQGVRESERKSASIEKDAPGQAA